MDLKNLGKHLLKWPHLVLLSVAILLAVALSVSSKQRLETNMQQRIINLNAPPYSTHPSIIKALEVAQRHGYNRMQIELQWDSEQHLSCLRPYALKRREKDPQTGKMVTRSADDPISIDGSSERPRARRCTMDNLKDWMKRNKEVTLYVSFRGAAKRGLRELTRTIPEATTRIIPQISTPEQMREALVLGYRKFVWHLRGPRDIGDFLSSENAKNVKYVSIPGRMKDRERLIEQLKSRRMIIYAREVNDCLLLKELLNYGVVGIYTRALRPDACDIAKPSDGRTPLRTLGGSGAHYDTPTGTEPPDETDAEGSGNELDAPAAPGTKEGEEESLPADESMDEPAAAEPAKDAPKAAAKEPPAGKEPKSKPETAKKPVKP